MAKIRAPGGGRKPKPTALKLLEGNLGKRPLPENEPQPRIAPNYPVPEWLGATAKKIWEYLVIELAACGLMTSIDVTKFARYCDAWERWKNAKDYLDKNGHSFEIFTVVDSPDPADPSKIIRRKMVTGYKTHPEVYVYNRMHLMLSEMESEFGMSPASRTRIQVLVSNPLGHDETPDPFAFEVGN